MDKYSGFKELGRGAFGRVFQAFDEHTGEAVAIKELKQRYASWEDCLNLREVKCLRKLNHSNIVKLKELIQNNNRLYLVFECMECNLYQLMAARDRKLFSEPEIKAWLFQVFQGLSYMHQNGFFHRDLKPENLLVSQGIIKIADFGLAREIKSGPPYTNYVGSRWYRAPEILLQSELYSSKADMWAMGAIMAELFTFCPLFPGASEADQMYKICGVLGSPTMDSWADGLRQARAIKYQFPQLPRANLSALMPSASRDAISLFESLCSWDPSKRPTAAEALQHPFFKRCFYAPPHIRSTPAVATTTANQPAAATRGMLKQRRQQQQQQQGARMCADEASSNSQMVGKLSPLDLIKQVQQKSVKQPKYSPAAEKKSPTSINKDKIAQLNLPHMMKTGVQWNAESGNLFLRPTQNLEPGRI